MTKYTNEATWANKTFENVVESYGRCLRYSFCKNTETLGNGFCQSCWDKDQYFHNKVDSKLVGGDHHGDGTKL